MPIHPSLQDCTAIGWEQQLIHNDRYFAKIIPAFGVAVYNAPDSALYQCQCFPCRDLFGGAGTLMDEYFRHAILVAGPTTAKINWLRRTYPFFTAPDVLTLKCIAEEAAQKWREDRCSTNSQR